MIKLLTTFVALTLLCGCSFLENQTPAQRAVIVKSISRTAAVAALSQVDDNQKLNRYAIVLRLGSRDIVKALNMIIDDEGAFEETVTVDLVKKLVLSLDFADDPLLAELARSSLDVLLANLDLSGVEDELVDYIGSDNVRLVIAAIEGIGEGAALFLPEGV
jgi:hypothetical protein